MRLNSHQRHTLFEAFRYSGFTKSGRMLRTLRLLEAKGLVKVDHIDADNRHPFDEYVPCIFAYATPAGADWLDHRYDEHGRYRGRRSLRQRKTQ